MENSIAPLGSVASIVSSLALSAVCFVVMAWGSTEDYGFKSEYLLPFLLGLLGVLLEVDWMLTEVSFPLRNLAWNFKDIYFSLFVIWMILKKEFPK
jgi:hypothetical protein